MENLQETIFLKQELINDERFNWQFFKSQMDIQTVLKNEKVTALIFEITNSNNQLMQSFSLKVKTDFPTLLCYYLLPSDFNNEKIIEMQKKDLHIDGYFRKPVEAKFYNQVFNDLFILRNFANNQEIEERYIIKKAVANDSMSGSDSIPDPGEDPR